ncbi:GGDEF domain-containing protein [Propylenella binzhouense]|nr:GGDEF domain-containing protein [Propylenella binzhouense]
MDRAILAAALLTALLVALVFDIVVKEEEGNTAGLMIEMNEALGLALLIVFGLLVYGVRRLRDQRRELEARLQAETEAKRALQLALLDPLTGVANRRHFQDTFTAASDGRIGTNAVFMLDMDGFKAINDTYGHAAGDEVLKVVALRLQAAVGRHNLVSRLGGDEFAVLVFNIGGESDAERLKQRMRYEAEQPIPIGRAAHSIGVAIGLSLFPQEGADAAAILARADEALYRDKRMRQAGLSRRGATAPEVTDEACSEPG